MIEGEIRRGRISGWSALCIILATCAAASSCMTNNGGSDRGEGNSTAATVAYIGEPLDTAPTNGTWFHEQTPAQVTSLLGTTNRLVSIQVAQASPLLLTGTMVPNTGNYQKTWWWFTALTPAQLQLFTQTLRARPVSMDAYVSSGSTVFAVVMISNSGTEDQGWHWYNGGSLTDLTNLVQQGNRLIDLRRTGTGSNTQYTALMVSNSGPDATQSWWYTGLTPAQISANLSTNDAFLVSLSPADTTGATYDVVMNRSVGIGWGWYFDISASQLSGLLTQNQMRPVDVKSVTVNNQRFYTTIMLQNTWSAAQQANAACDATVTGGWLANPVATGLGTPSTVAAYDAIYAPMMKAYGIPGGAVSVIRNGKLVLTRAYGFSDQQQMQLAHPDSLFRVASVSKQLTSAAILMLVDSGQIQLSDTPFTVLGLTPNPPNVNDHTTLNSITVAELLHQAGGFSRETNGPSCTNCLSLGDPVGTPDTFTIAKDQNLGTGVCTTGGTISCGQPPKCDQIIQWVMSHPDSQTVLWTPGSTYDYSNFGYCVLGAMIEKVTGTDYGTWVTNNILNPVGAHDVHPGLTLPTQDREVTYYDPGTATSVFDPQNLVGAVPAQYGNYFVEGSPASGGWIASTIDWLRFQAAIDGRSGGTPLLSAARITDLTANPLIPSESINSVTHLINNTDSPASTSSWYGTGWSVNTFDNWWHNGALQGTATEQIRAGNGFGFASFFNTSPPDVSASIVAPWNTPACNGNFFCNMDSAFWTAFNNAGGTNGNWFSQDLFDQYASYTGWMTGSQYQAYFDQQVQSGLYPTRIEGINHFGTPMFRAAFAPFKGFAWESHHGFGCTDYQAINASLASRGYTQTSLQSYVDTDGTRRYQATWVDWSACSPSCTSGSPCTGNADCQSGICTSGTCAPPVCAPTCGVGANCGSNADCASGLCKGGKCAAPSCSPSCTTGQPCTANTDCASFVCTAGACAPPSCATAPSKCNQNNPCGSDSDCGSNVCAHGLCAPPACSPSCGNGSSCNNNSNCASFVCGTNFTCKSPACATQPGKCNQGSPCGTNSDCGAGICMSGTCQRPACAPTCGNGTACNNNGDCGSNVCTNNVCHAPACAPNCGSGLSCGANGDCRSHVCNSARKCQ